MSNIVKGAMPVVVSGGDTFTQLAQRLKEFPRRMNQAQATAINKTLAGMKTEAKQAITERANIKSGVVAKFIDIDKATIETPVGVLSVSKDKRIPIHHFGAKDNGEGKGITYQIDKTKPWQVIPNAFGHPQKRNKRGKLIGKNFQYVAVRRGKARYPLRFPSGPSVWGVFNKFGVWKVVREAAERRFRVEVQRAVDFHVGQLNGTIKRRERDGIIVRGGHPT
jgi:hypothetical protein